MTVDMLQELWVAREKLAQEGRPKTVTNVTVKTWSGYCTDISIRTETVRRWLFVPLVDGVFVERSCRRCEEVLGVRRIGDAEN